MSSINLELGPVIKCTSVPNIFIDQYMPNAPHAYSLIYLYLLRNGSNEYFKLDTKKMGENFNLLESDIINAFLFWHQKQVINYSNKDGHIDIKFLDLKPFKPIGLAAEDKRDEGSQEVTAPVSLKVLEAPSAIAAISSKPNYSNEEIKFSTEKSKELRSLLNFAQNKICRPLKPQEVHAIYSFVDWLRMPVPLVEKLIEYCVVDRKKMSVQYMEAVAISWADNKIKTVEEAETLTESSSFYTKVLNTFGVYGRFANDGEIKYINSWLNEYKLSEQMILLACTRMTGMQPNTCFPYVNGIIKSWCKNGVKTPSDLEKYDADFKEQKNENQKNNKFSNRKKTYSNKKSSKLNNFDCEEWDYDELAFLETQYIYENEMKGLS